MHLAPGATLLAARAAVRQRRKAHLLAGGAPLARCRAAAARRGQPWLSRCALRAVGRRRRTSVALARRLVEVERAAARERAVVARRAVARAVVTLLVGALHTVTADGARRRDARRVAGAAVGVRARLADGLLVEVLAERRVRARGALAAEREEAVAREDGVDVGRGRLELRERQLVGGLRVAARRRDVAEARHRHEEELARELVLAGRAELLHRGRVAVGLRDARRVDAADRAARRAGARSEEHTSEL